jgi:hypothetical protein
MMNTLSSRVLAGLFAIAFVIYVGRGSKSAGRTTPSCLITGGLLSIALAMGIPPQQAMAATPLTNGATVRVTSQSIDAGWHKGRMHLDAKKCWMVQLDKATQDGYTMIALIGVAELQVAQSETWAAADVKTVIKTQPSVCMEYDAD